MINSCHIIHIYLKSFKHEQLKSFFLFPKALQLKFNLLGSKIQLSFEIISNNLNQSITLNLILMFQENLIYEYAS